ncbi:MAG: LPXTG cell wall anchor domain-containing protein [Clostridia bacterium]|nr:LPXTG cell wall anchor domain-containing protein [Clostridia bacterium]
MKKKFFITLLIVFTFCACTFNIFAAQGYDFKLEYEGNVVQNIEVKANVKLIGSSATPYSNVRIKVDVKGPGTPTIFAKDSNGKEFDIIKLGYWGPAGGFPVGGNFTNTTPIRTKFPEVGKYTITLSLLNVSNGNAVITADSFEVNVLSNNPPMEEPNELPQTGMGLQEYILYSLIIIAIILIAILMIRRNKQKE